MTAGAVPSPLRYRRLTRHFQACVDLPKFEREAYINGPAIEDAALRDELRSLLRYHTRSAMDALSFPRPSRSLRVNTRRLGALLAIAAMSASLVLLLRAWALDRMEGSLREDGARRIQEVLRHRKSLLEAWMERKKSLARAVLRAPDFLAGSVDAEIAAARMAVAPERLGELGYLLCDPMGGVLRFGPDANFEKAVRVRDLPMEEVVVSRPRAGREFGLKESDRSVIVVGGPVHDARGAVAAVGLFLLDVEGLEAALAVDGTDELLLFDERGLVVNGPKSADKLRGLGLLEGPRAHLRDPGRELRAGAPVDLLSAPPTRMYLSATRGVGVDARGYRNILGRPVIGAWDWLPEQSLGLAVERDVDDVLAPLTPLRSTFLCLLGIMGLLVMGMGVSLRVVRRGREGEASLGFYVQTASLGRGGMATVVLAEHSVLKRRVALKILTHPRPSAADVASFRREARVASRLRHPNAVQIFDYGELSDGRQYFAMEYVEGLTLSQLLTLERHLPVGRALYLMEQLSGALEEAHALGVVHRDLKPSNVMVGLKGAMGDVVKVLDYGIASAVEGESDDATRGTRLIGTPAFLAPERIRQPGRLDPRSDVYSFGAVAFHLLTGRSVFEGPGTAELLYQVLTAERPSPANLRGEALPADLERLILDCLSVEPEGRPTTMAEVTRRLRAIDASEPWSQDQARAWWSANAASAERLRMLSA